MDVVVFGAIWLERLCRFLEPERGTSGENILMLVFPLKCSQM